MRTWTVQYSDSEQFVFHGFDKNFDGTSDIAVFNVEGEIEVWAVDNRDAISNIIDYYKCDGFPATLVGYYKRVTQ